MPATEKRLLAKRRVKPKQLEPSHDAAERIKNLCHLEILNEAEASV